ncbi:MAG TPA: SpoVR family protein, partial [Arenicellales bacterium]|nr:SpoVR family protein [Arenicellales bacterium]
MTDKLARYQAQMEELAAGAGLDFYPVDFERVPASFMMEVAVYGLPVRMPHWSFGVRYIYQLVQHRMGNSRLFEVVFPGKPGRAYLDKSNSVPENTLVTAHVFGHADFSKRNELFRRSQEQVGYRIVEQAAEHARQIASAIETHGAARVEAVLDAALSLEAHISISKGMRREPYPEYLEPQAEDTDPFRKRYHDLGDTGGEGRRTERERAPLPPYPEHDLLWFIATYAPDMEGWERDIFLAVRAESYYFYPVFATQIMNEGWASYWHARLLREAAFLPHDEYLDAIKTHSDVVRPYAGGDQVTLSVNPYHLGFSMWERIIEEHDTEHAFRIAAEDDDFSFVRNYLTEDLAEELELFGYRERRGGGIEVMDFDINELRETILAPKFNFGAPSVAARGVRVDGTLELVHAYAGDGRGLDLERAHKVLDYVHRVWRRPVDLLTI